MDNSVELPCPPTPQPSQFLMENRTHFLFHSLPADTSGSHGNLHQLTHLEGRGQGGSGGHWGKWSRA